MTERFCWMEQLKKDIEWMEQEKACNEADEEFELQQHMDAGDDITEELTEDDFNRFKDQLPSGNDWEG